MEQYAGEVDVNGRVWKVFATPSDDGLSVENLRMSWGCAEWDWKKGEKIPNEVLAQGLKFAQLKLATLEWDDFDLIDTDDPD